MAGRPATVRGGGLTGLHYGMITFVVISVASLGGFIFQLTKVKAAEDSATRTQRDLDKYGRPSGSVGSYYENEASARNSTVFAVMGKDLAMMAHLIAGKEEAVGATLKDEVDGLLKRIAAEKTGVINAQDTLLEAVRGLDEELDSQLKRNETLSQQLAEKEALVTSRTQELDSVRLIFEEQVGQLKTQISDAADDFTNKLAEKETQLSEMANDLEVKEQQLQQLIREGDKEKRELQLEITRKDHKIAKLNKDIQDLKGSFDPEAILRKADGRILRAIPGSDVVYINLGANDNIKVGMGFVVFSQTGSRDLGLRGKASLEIATVEENTAECRVLRTKRGQPIMEGDIVVNIAYEEGRRPKFVIRGDFDLNYDGQIDFDGVDAIAGIVRQWGGQIVPELDESVDYIVIGMAPRVVDVGAGASDIVRDQAERRLLALSQFRRLIDRARSMYIPVITQSQFLFLTGYAGEGTVRER